MKITFNTSNPTAPCTEFYTSAFKGIEEITFYDQNYSLYDIALFMTYDYEKIKYIKESFPHLKIGIIDPRSNKVYDSTQYCDFIIVDSIEMEDYWRISKRPIFRYVEYPNIPYIKKEHKEKDKIIIGYHGNQIHLECMTQNVTPALTVLGKKYNIELLIMHNSSPPTGNEKWYPKNISVRHVPWSMNNYVQELARSDIGIVPNNLIHDISTKKMLKTHSAFNCNDDDYSLRFKMPSNPGRIIVFGKLGIPTVADFYPSALELSYSRALYVAHSLSGWIHSLEKLIISSNLRQQMGDLLQLLVRSEFDFELQNKKLISSLKLIL